MSIISLVRVVFGVYYFLLFARVIFSWIRVSDNVFTRFVYDVTEPVMSIFRRLFPPRPSFPLDLSPILAFIVLQLLETIIIRIILRF
ncbi:MAG: YggT family protein [Clostridia bacterium]|nr:YggT family protein [Clostridia bacterium]